MTIINSSIIHSGIVKSSIITNNIIGSGDGANPLRPSQGWTGDENCTTPSDTQITIKFNQEVTFNSQNGVTFNNLTTGDTSTAPNVTSVTVSPASAIVYDVVWGVAAPVEGDEVEYVYENGTYQDSEGELMANATISVVNCLDTGVPPVISDITILSGWTGNKDCAIAPAFDGIIADMAATIDEALTGISIASNFDSAGVPDSYTLIGHPSWMSVNNSGDILGTPLTGDDIVTAGITATATNAAGTSSPSNAFSMDVGSGSRQILTWNGVDSYGSFTPTVGLSDSFIISFTMDGAEELGLVSAGGTNNSYIRAASSGRLLIYPDSTTSYSSADNALTPGNRDIVVTYNGTTAVVTVDGLEVINETMDSGFQNFGFLGSRGDTGVSFASTSIKDFRIQNTTQGTDYFWAIDSGSTVSEESTADAYTLTFNNVVAGDWSTEI